MVAMRAFIVAVIATAYASAGHAAEISARPEIFAPGVIAGPVSTDSATFTPDGRMVFFDRGVGRDSMIMVSHRTAKGWSAPELAPFSGQWSDRDPAMAPDGTFLIFCSNRAETPSGKALDMVMANGQVRTAQGYHLWRVDRRGAGWETPHPLPASINDGTRMFSPSVARDGSLWFQKPDPKYGVVKLFRSQWRDGAYQSPVETIIAAPEADERDPAVAPDESFLVFTTGAKGVQGRLHIAFREGDRWGKPQDLGDAINSDGAEGAHLGPDGRTLYFDASPTPAAVYPRTRAQALGVLKRWSAWDNGDGHIFRVSLAPWLEAHAKAH